MELGAHVWLRKEDSHWGWVPAVITKKENVTHSGVDLINLTLNDDPQIEKTLPPPSTAKGRYHPHSRGGAKGNGGASNNYFADQESFEVVLTVDPEQLKTADHDEIKLRNLPNSFHLQGEDPEARVVASPSTHSQAGIVGGVNDLIDLTHLHEPAILHALRLRYDANIIYTSTGPILIAVNPFRKMDIYGANIMEKYCLQGEKTSSGTSTSFTTPFKSRRVNGKPTPQQSRLPPHVYQAADDAYRAMMRGMENRELMANPKEMRRGDSNGLALQRENPTDQSILVSGESGAGKTVTTKFVLNYFAMLSRRRAQLGIATPRKGGGAGSNPARVSIEQQVLQSNPILESFGNARTIRNDNSSRFGKYIDIRFTRAGKLSGAQIETYLLEKVRLIHPGPGERNYHVFYQFLRSATRRERNEFFLGRMGLQDFRLLNLSNTYDRRDGVSDESNHKEMLDAMLTVGFHPEEVHNFMRLVSAVLFAGNISFTPSHDGESCRLNEDDAALACAALLGISFEGLAAALTTRVILAGDEIVQTVLDVAFATKATEALIKALYGALFDYLVERINASIDEHHGDEMTASIGVLDIFGFETFESNSFEQLCINYTNEALQQQFNKYVFKLEQQEYEKEGIMWKFISFPDNQDVLDLIDAKRTGILALLDEQCILPRSTDQKLTGNLYGRCDKHPRFSASSAQRVDYLFSIEHYAGFVEYCTDGWIEKNKDQLPAASSDLLKSSDFGLIDVLQPYVRSEDRAGRGTIATKSVSSQFSQQLKVLRARIDETVPHYVRCLKPNDDLVPGYFEPKNIVEQLRCNGVLEAVRVSRAGYPTRYPHDVFLARYSILGEPSASDAPQSPVFSPGSQTYQTSALKQLIGKISFDLWYADHVIMQKLALADQPSEAPVGSHNQPQLVGRANTYKSKGFKMHSGPRGPAQNLVVEHSNLTPEGKRKKKKNDPAAAMRERRERHNVMRPETADDFLALDFPSRCAISGLQLGRTKVFLRRDAFDRIEAMRSDKYFQAAATIQKIVRGRLCRTYYLYIRYAAIMIQSMIRMRLSRNRSGERRQDMAATKIQSVWRSFVARLEVYDLVMARRYAATMIQRTWRSYIMGSSLPSEDDIIYAIIRIQALWRGRQQRKSFKAQAKQRRLSVFRSSAAPMPASQFRVSPPKKDIVLAQKQISASPSSRELTASLFSEIQKENWAMVENMLDKNPQLAEVTDLKTGELALHKIARHPGAWTLLVDMVLVLYPKALIHRDNMGALPVHHASAHDNLAALEIIYSAYKEGISEVDAMGRLPIHVASTYDAVDAVKFLLSKSSEGAYTMVHRPPADSGGGLPLHVACANHASIAVVTALLAENFSSAKRADENGDLPIHLLLRCGEVVDPVIVKTLLSCFAESLSRTDSFGDLPLAIAIKYQCRSPVITSILMQYPEAAHALNGEGHSPLFLAFKHNADDRTIMGLLNHAPDHATMVDRKTGLLPIQMATENEHSHFIVHNLLKRDLPIDTQEKVRAQMIPHHYSWNHVVSNTDDLYHQVVTKVLQSCTQPQVLALAHVEGPDGKIALASATPVCKHEMRVMLRLFNTLEVVNQRPAYVNPQSDTQIFYALRYDPPPNNNGQYTVLHEEKKDGENDYVEDMDDQSFVSAVSRHSIRSTLTSRSQHTIEEKLRHIRKEKGQQVIAKLTSRSDVVERELKVRKEHHLSRHYVPAIISVHHTVQHAAYSEAMAEPGYCITMEGADTTAENLMLDMRKSGKKFPAKALKRIGISLLHMHEHGVVHGDFGTHNIGKFGSRWKLLGVGGSVPIGRATDPTRGFYHPPESVVVESRRVSIGKKSVEATVKSISGQPTYDIWAFGVVVYEAIAGVPLSPYACRGKREMTDAEIAKIGAWDEASVRKALKHVESDSLAQDLLKRLLHHKPSLRFSSMREVLEHDFFTSGSMPSGRLSLNDPSPRTVNSAPTRPSSLSTSSGSLGLSAVNSRQRDSAPANMKSTGSSDSLENRENNVRKLVRQANEAAAANNSPSNGSVRSGLGFRKRLSSLSRR